MLQGIYTPDIEVVPVTSGGPYIRMADPPNLALATHRGPVCIAAADVTGVGGVGRFFIEVGTWNGAAFTSEQVIGSVSALANQTEQIFVLSIINKGKAIRISSDGAGAAIAATTTGFVRIQGKTIQVSP